jgi:hypothetical protein
MAVYRPIPVPQKKVFIHLPLLRPSQPSASKGRRREAFIRLLFIRNKVSLSYILLHHKAVGLGEVIGSMSRFINDDPRDDAALINETTGGRSVRSTPAHSVADATRG